MIERQRKNIYVWTLYDFANSVSTIVFFLYFSQWLVVDHGVSDFWYNMIFAIGSLLLLLTAPVLGALADRNGSEQRYLNRMTILVLIFYLATTVMVLFYSQQVFLAAFFFLIANFLYQFSFVFYNALLHHIAPREKWGIISGIGQAGNWLGQLVGLIVTFPFAIGAIYLFGEPGRGQTLLPSIILFFGLALPMLLFFRLERNIPPPNSTSISIVNIYRNQWRQFCDLIRSPSMGVFLLAYFFFNDAVITASNNFPIFMEQVYGVSDSVKSILLMGILVTSAIGAIGAGWIADRAGLKSTLLGILLGWIFIFPMLGLIHSFSIFVVLTIIMGFLFGAIWTVTRAAMTALCPKHQLNFGFSFYTLAERVSTLVGPLTWGIITTALLNLGATRYRIALVSMTLFVLIGYFLMKKVEIQKNIETDEFALFSDR